jgi:nitrite reductase/ring-hydroxylating ferredoxin subunit
MVPEGEIRPINEDLCIARIDGRPVAFYRGCPHEGADLAGGAIRHGQIMCPWHGLRISPVDGTSGCKTLEALELVPCAEQGGTILVGAAAAVEPAPAPQIDEHDAAVAHFTAAADRFVTLHESYRAAPSPDKLEQLTSARDAAVYALLGLPGSVVRARLAMPATRLLGAIHDSETRYRARTPEQEASFAECCRRLAQSWGGDAGYVYGLAALALCWHGYELVELQPLRQELGWAEPIWLQYLLTAPPSFREPGQAEIFAATIEPLMEQIEERLERATPETRPGLVNAFVSADIMVPGYFNELNMRPAMLARARAIEKLMLLEGARLDQLVVRAPGRRRPRIGFIAIAVQDRTESVFLLAHMEHLGRQGFDVRLYCRKDPEGKIGILCRNAAAHYARLPDSILTATTYLRAEDLDIAVFASNLTAPVNAPVMYAAQRIARIQVTGTWSPLTSGLRQVDAMLSGEYGEPAGAEAQYSEALIRLPGGHACFPFERMLDGERTATSPTRAELGVPEEAIVFVSAAFGGKILPELSRDWTRIISAVPDSYLVLLPFNPNWSRRFDTQALLSRLSAEWAMAGLAPDRLRILNPLPTVADLHLVLGLCDIYLDSFPYTGACSIFDPVAVGLPIVARAGETCRSRQSYTMLREIGLEDWVATTAEGYVERAIRLGTDPDYLAEEATRLVLSTAERPPFVDTERYAAKLAPALTGLIDAWEARSAALHALPAATRLDRIAQLGGRLGRLRADFTGRDVLEEIVLPYLRHGGRRHFIHVGRDFDSQGKALLQEGWMGILFGPDGRPAQERGTAPGQGADIGIAAQIDQSMFNDANLIVIDAAGNDFAILAGLNFGVMSPGLVTATHDPRRPGQDSDATERVLVGMLKNGYRSAYFSLDFDPSTGLTQLVDIGVDSVPPKEFTAVLVFFRAADEIFLPSLLGWLEDATGLTAETRLRAATASIRKAKAKPQDVAAE